MLLSELALLLFALAPGGWKVVAIFFSALPLGMVWGLVFSYLEGRRLTDLLGAGLCSSFIIASAFAKSVATWLLNAGVPEAWMPAAAGLCYLPLFLAAVWMLRRIPHPNSADIDHRVDREPMDRRARLKFYRSHGLGLSLLMLVYTILTVCRDLRDNFAPEMFAEHGLEHDPAIFVKTETPVALAVLVLVGLLFIIRNNRRALLVNHLYGILGAGILAGATLLFDAGRIDVTWWMVINGFGLFLAYIPFNCILFDRLVAVLGVVATSVFLICVADALGYLGVVAVLLYKNFGDQSGSMLAFYRSFCYASSGVVALAMLMSWLYFRNRGVRSE